MLILKKCMKCVLRVGSSQRSPRIMHAWERCVILLFQKEYAGSRVKCLSTSMYFKVFLSTTSTLSTLLGT